MRLGWRTPRVDSLKLVNYTRIEDGCTQEFKGGPEIEKSILLSLKYWLPYLL